MMKEMIQGARKRAFRRGWKGGATHSRKPHEGSYAISQRFADSPAGLQISLTFRRSP